MFSTIIVDGARLHAGESPAFKMEYDHKDGHIDLPPPSNRSNVCQCISERFHGWGRFGGESPYGPQIPRKQVPFRGKRGGVTGTMLTRINPCDISMFHHLMMASGIESILI